MRSSTSAEADAADSWLPPPFSEREIERWLAWSNTLAVSRAIGIKCTSAENGRAWFSMERSPWPLNPNGAAHGGLVAAIADHCVGMVIHTTLLEGDWPATASLTVDYHRPCRFPLTARAWVARAGAAISFVEVEIVGPDHRRCAKATATMHVRRGSRRIR